MNRKFGISVLILSFGLSSVNAGLASQTVDSSPIIVQPYDDLKDISQQMLAQDQVNRDQDSVLRGLIDDDQRLADTAVARQQDATLEKIDQTLIKYRDFLINRDKLRLEAADKPRISKYHDLIALTEDVDNQKGEGSPAEFKTDFIEDKVKILTELKDEMQALNNKLNAQTAPQYTSQNAIGQQQILNSNDKDEVRWLRLVLWVAKNKAEYYQLTSEEDQIYLQQFQQQVQKIEGDFNQRYKVYGQFEKAIVSLKDQVARFAGQLSVKQEQVDLLKSELENKITEAQHNDRLNMARQLIDLQQKQTALLEEKSRLSWAQNVLYDNQVRDLENKIDGILTDRQRQMADLNTRMEEFKNELHQKTQQVDLLKSTLNGKIMQEKDQSILVEQIRDLKVQLQDREKQIASLKAQVRSGMETQAQADTLKQQLADQQNNVGLLKQELDTKNAQADQMAVMIKDYQNKLELKNEAFNQQFKQSLLSKNDQAQMEAQISDLSARLQQKEAQIVRMKRDMYDLQNTVSNKDRELQARDLDLSVIQQKLAGGNIKEYLDKIYTLQTARDKQVKEIAVLKADLALARQQLKGMPSSDEIEYLRTGLQKATAQLKQKDDLIAQTKANADEYQKEFKAQSSEFQSLKVQLQDATDELARRNEDLKYKKLELARFKEQTAVKEGDLMAQVKALTRKLVLAGKELKGAPLSKEETQIIMPSGNDALSKKLKEALDKIDEQGRMINVLVQKLQDAGQSVDLSRIKSN